MEVFVVRFIPIEKLVTGMILAQDIFSFYGSYLPLLTKGQCLNTTLIQRMQSYGLQGAYIQQTSQENSSILRSKIPSPIRQEALSIVENFFASIRNRNQQDGMQVLQNVDTIVNELVETLKENKGMLVNISDLKSYDDYTYHHSVSVAILSMAMGTYMGLSGKQLHKLGKSALLHDIGKVQVPIQLIQKPGKLTDEEFEEVKHHAEFGFEYLLKHSKEPEDIANIIRHHHEKYDGTGYPLGLKGENIPFFSRIISVADVYDALTSNRPYRKPMQPADAVEYIMGGCDTLFDTEVVKAFMDKIELYPKGSYIELSNHKIAKVLSCHKTRPLIELVDTKSIIDLSQDPNYLNVVIKRCCEEPPSQILASETELETAFSQTKKGL